MTGPIMIGKDKDAAKGALVAYTGPDAVGVVPAGREGEALVADPAAAAGVRWGKALGGGIETVSGTVTLDATGEPIREFYTTGATTFYANGTTTPVAAHTAVVWRRTGVGSWGYQEVPDEWTTPTPAPDTTPPAAGALAVSVTDKTATLTATSATDDIGVTGYKFSKDGGATWTATWQPEATYTFTGLTMNTDYVFRHQVKDAAGNVTMGVSVTKRTSSVPSFTTLEAAIKYMGPVGYWKLDETSGTQAIDSSGNSRHGTYEGAFTLAGQDGAALFNGGKVTIPSSADFSPVVGGGFTIFGMGRTTLTTRQMMVTKGAAGAYEWGQQVNNEGSLETSLMDAAGEPIQGAKAPHTASAWQAVCASFPVVGAAKAVSYYKNSGIPTGSAAPVRGTAFTAGSAPVVIGARGDAAPAWKGGIRHVAIFGRALSQAEVESVMNAAKTEGLIA